jgi:hypothetical protein
MPDLVIDDQKIKGFNHQVLLILEIAFSINQTIYISGHFFQNPIGHQLRFF